jgi:hypothetical protein
MSLKYDPLYPGWYYSYVDIPNYEEIKQELLDLYKSGIVSTRSNPDYYNVSVGDIKNCPKLFQYLSIVGVFDKFSRVLFSTNVPRTDVVHVDGYHPTTKNHFSLNIPLIDCEDSYTAFYKYCGNHLRFKIETYHHYASMSMDKVEEIARVECTRPVLVNTTILHRGLTNKLTRTLASIRFHPALTVEELRNLGIKNPLVQEDV